MSVQAIGPARAATPVGAVPASRPAGQAEATAAPEPAGHVPGAGLPEQAIRLLQPFFPRLNLRRVHVDDSSPYSQWLIGQAGAGGLTVGNHIYFARGAYEPATVDGLALIGHELTHVQQYQDRGRAGFFWRYGTDYLRNRLNARQEPYQAYEDIRAEQEAYQMEARIRRELAGKVPQRFARVS